MKKDSQNKSITNEFDYRKTMSGVMALLEEACPDISKLFMLTGSGAASCFTLLPNGNRGLSHAVSLDIDLHSRQAHESIGKIVEEIHHNLRTTGVEVKNEFFDEEYGMLQCELHIPAGKLGTRQKEPLCISLDIAAGYEETPISAYESEHGCGFSTPVVNFDHYVDMKLSCVRERTQVKDHFHLFCVGKEFPELQKKISRGYNQIPFIGKPDAKELFDTLKETWKEERKNITGMPGLRSSKYEKDFPKFLETMEMNCLRNIMLKEAAKKPRVAEPALL